MKKVYGDRICRVCKGICHQEVFRERFGERKKYFCCSHCLKSYIEEKIKKHIKNNHVRQKFSLTVEEFEKHWAGDFEVVWVN